jgi:hypothetical protein
MEAPFDGATVPDNWSGVPGGPGTAGIEFSFVPVYGSADDLRGQVWHITPSDYKVAVYIFVASGWWTKPYFAQPLTNIQPEGRWIADITTGGVDHQATKKPGSNACGPVDCTATTCRRKRSSVLTSAPATS